MNYTIKILLGIQIILFTTISCQNTIEADLIISNIDIVNVNTGNVLESQDVAIQNGIITHIVKHNEKNNYITPKIVDGSKKFLIPGLWDMHAHIFDDGTPNLWKLKLMTTYGITGVREMYILPNEQIDTVKSWNKAIQEKTKFIPRIGAVGTLVDGNPSIFKGVDTVITKQSAREFVGKLKSKGVDFVKTYDNLSKEAFDELIIEAEKADVYVAGHIPKSISIEYASEAGIKSIEHSTGLNIACSHQEDSLRIKYSDKNTNAIQADMELAFQLLNSYDSVKNNQLNKVLAKNKTWVAPTLVLLKNWMNGETIETIEKRIDLTLIPTKEYSSDWKYMRDFKQYAPTDYQLALKEYYAHQQRLLLEMHKEGVLILAGTDVGTPYIFPGLSLLDELEEMTNAGLTNLEALQTATLNPAIYLNKKEVLGTVDVGKYADLVILNDNPLIDIKNLKSNSGTVINGQLFDRNELDALLEKVKEEVVKKN